MTTTGRYRAHQLSEHASTCKFVLTDREERPEGVVGEYECCYGEHDRAQDFITRCLNASTR